MSGAYIEQVRTLALALIQRDVTETDPTDQVAMEALGKRAYSVTDAMPAYALASIAESLDRLAFMAENPFSALGTHGEGEG